MSENKEITNTSSGVKPKGLKKGSVSLIGAVAIGLAATAPAYSLTGALGPGAREAGYQLPIIFIIAVIPMYFVALAYKHHTDAAPDAGTVFTWGSKAILPHIGWVGGFALMLSSILAGVGAAGITANAASVALGLGDPAAWVKVLIASAFILFTTWLVARGAEESSRTTLLLTIIQFGGLVLFTAILVVNVLQHHRNPTAEAVSWEWFNPFAIHGASALIGGFLVAIFIFWGFDASMAMSEETEGTPEQSGSSGLTAIIITVITYVVIGVATLAYAGIDSTSTSSLTHESNIGDVFSSLARQTVGPVGALVAAGVPEEDAHVYSEGVRRGGTLVTVKSPAEQLDEARSILDDNDSIDISERRAAYVADGWSGFDDSATPVESSTQPYRDPLSLR